jgi:hypothetical protein
VSRSCEDAADTGESRPCSLWPKGVEHQVEGLSLSLISRVERKTEINDHLSDLVQLQSNDWAMPEKMPTVWIGYTRAWVDDQAMFERRKLGASL